MNFEIHALWDACEHQNLSMELKSTQTNCCSRIYVKELYTKLHFLCHGPLSRSSRLYCILTRHLRFSSHRLVMKFELTTSSNKIETGATRLNDH